MKTGDGRRALRGGAVVSNPSLVSNSEWHAVRECVSLPLRVTDFSWKNLELFYSFRTDTIFIHWLSGGAVNGTASSLLSPGPDGLVESVLVYLPGRETQATRGDTLNRKVL